MGKKVTQKIIRTKAVSLFSSPVLNSKFPGEKSNWHCYWLWVNGQPMNWLYLNEVPTQPDTMARCKIMMHAELPTSRIVDIRSWKHAYYTYQMFDAFPIL